MPNRKTGSPAHKGKGLGTIQERNSPGRPNAKKFGQTHVTGDSYGGGSGGARKPIKRK